MLNNGLHIIPGNSEYVVSHGKKNSEDIIKAHELEILSWIILMGPL